MPQNDYLVDIGQGRKVRIKISPGLGEDVPYFNAPIPENLSFPQTTDEPLPIPRQRNVPSAPQGREPFIGDKDWPAYSKWEADKDDLQYPNDPEHLKPPVMNEGDAEHTLTVKAGHQVPIISPSDRYNRLLQDVPQRSDYKPSLLRKILAGSVGASEGYSRGPTAGIQAGQEVLERPYNRALSDYRVQLGAGKEAVEEGRRTEEMGQRERTVGIGERKVGVEEQELPSKIEENKARAVYLNRPQVQPQPRAMTELEFYQATRDTPEHQKLYSDYIEGKKTGESPEEWDRRQGITQKGAISRLREASRLRTQEAVNTPAPKVSASQQGKAEEDSLVEIANDPRFSSLFEKANLQGGGKANFVSHVDQIINIKTVEDLMKEGLTKTQAQHNLQVMKSELNSKISRRMKIQGYTPEEEWSEPKEK